MGACGVSDGWSSGILHLAFLAGNFMTFMHMTFTQGIHAGNSRKEFAIMFEP